MRKSRQWEFALVVGIVAGVMAYARTDLTPHIAATPAVIATKVPPSEPIQNFLAKSPGEVPSPFKFPAIKRLIWESSFAEAQAFLGQGDNIRAQVSLLKALEVAWAGGPDALHRTHDLLAQVAYRQGDYGAAVDSQRNAIENAKTLRTPGRDAMVGLYESRYAEYLQASDRRDEALQALARAEAAYDVGYPGGSPASAEARSRLAEQYRSLGDMEGAARLVGD